MTGFQGMDTAQVGDFSGVLGTHSSTIEDRFSTLEGLVRSIIGSQWVGSDADDFGQRFSSEVMSKVQEALEQLRRRIDELGGHIDEQDSASDPSDGGFFDGIFDALGDALDTVGNFVKDAWNDFTQDILPTWADAVSNAAGVVADKIKHGIDDALKAAPDLGKSAGKRLLSSALPVVGDVATGVMAGIDRWQQDSSNHPDMGFGEHLGRAVFDGGANAAGSFVGGTLGSAIGAPAGAALGGLFGGGGDAVATSPTGPGAAVGGGVGAVGGGGLGGTIGAYAGDVIGSYFGGRAGDAIADSILD